MTERITYRAGVATCWVVNSATHFEYSCGPLQHRRIDKATIIAVGISDDRHLTDYVAGGRMMQKLLRVQGGLGGLLIAYRESGQPAPILATVTFDFGVHACQTFVQAMTEEFSDRYVGIDTRDALMQKMGVRRLKENMIIAALILGIALGAALITWS